MEKVLSHVDVNFLVNDCERGGITFTLKATLNESLTMLSMPSLSPYIVSLVPCYETPEVSQMPEEEC